MTRRLLIALALVSALLALALMSSRALQAGGWSTIHRYAHPTGRCGSREVLGSFYGAESGRRTASGERFNPEGHTAASLEFPIGTTLHVTNPHNGLSVTVRVNDRGPYGEARRQGAVVDLAHGAARAIGMHAAQYICIAR